MSHSNRWQTVLPTTSPENKSKKIEPVRPLYEQAKSMPLSQDMSRHGSS